MLKRIAIVAFFTGSGQLLSVFVLKFISQYAEVEQLKSIAEIDSLVFFMMNVIALGLQSAAMRNLAQDANWQQEYHDTQSARITLGLLMMAAALLSFINQYYLVFLIAPIFAWSGDYALYGRGYPVAGSVVAFVRLAIPFSAVLVSAIYYPDIIGWVYVVALLVVYLITNIYISYFLKTAYFFRPSFKNLGLYIYSLPLGIVAVSLYFLGLGLVLIVPYFFLSPVVAVAFLGLKLYVIFKGVLRIIHQAFIKEMMQYEVCLRVDQLCTLIGLTFAAFTLCFPKSFIRLFFGEKYIADKNYFMLLAVAGLIYSLFSSLTTRAMLEKKDKPYAVIAGGAAIFTILLTMVFSYVWPGTPGIGLSLLIGETTFAAGMLWLMHRPVMLSERLGFLARNLALVLIPLSSSYFFGDSLNAFIIAAVLFGAVMVLMYYNKFSLE